MDHLQDVAGSPAGSIMLIEPGVSSPLRYWGFGENIRFNLQD